jgi:GH15 family glucan-1,4-alpha-glucosidase
LIGGGDALPLRARGAIGDTGSLALVAADGTIDWWCPGRFDAPAALFRLLDPEGGAVRVGPAGVPRAGEQSYLPGTNVLRTRLPAPEGELEVVDLLPWNGRSPSGRIVRIVTALRGRVDVEVDVQPGSRFGPARDVTTWSGGIAFDGIVVQTGCAMDGRSGSIRLEAGERFVVVIEQAPDEGRRPEPLSVDGAFDLLDRTTTSWHSHLGPLTYAGTYRADVERSLLALKALTYGPTGTIVAAGTTSLPEHVGGERNWDYRYAWVRDASLAVDATYDAGLTDEAEHFNEWLLHVLDGATFPLRPLYDVDGHPLDPDDEAELALAGWRGSVPVRVGNGAADHLQLDFYADLVSTIHTEQFRREGSRVPDLWPALVRMADWLTTSWARPDRGIWEVRAEPQQLVSSKLACWYTFDRMVELARAQNPLDLDAVRWREAAKDVRAWLDAHALRVDGSLQAVAGEDDSWDGYLVQLAWRNPWPGDDRVVDLTLDRTLEALGEGPFLYRYPVGTQDGFPSGEGAFLACSFWAVEALARRGRWDEAHERMEALCGFSQPLGLLPEQADPQTGEFLGNLPQALSHLTLIQAALALEEGPA